MALFKANLSLVWIKCILLNESFLISFKQKCGEAKVKRSIHLTAFYYIFIDIYDKLYVCAIKVGVNTPH